MPALLLGGFVLAGTGLVALTQRHAGPRIESNERAWVLRGLSEIVPPARYDNEMFADTIVVTDAELLGGPAPRTVYRARRNLEPVAAIVETVAPDGYAGPIRLLVGINVDGSLAGVRVASHNETPGLGDAIEAEKSDWILAFEGLSLGGTTSDDWTVKSQGGLFDQFTGATITPRAVVRAVYRALVYFDGHREQIFAPSPTTGGDG